MENYNEKVHKTMEIKTQDGTFTDKTKIFKNILSNHKEKNSKSIL